MLRSLASAPSILSIRDFALFISVACNVILALGLWLKVDTFCSIAKNKPIGDSLGRLADSVTQPQ